MMNSKLIVAFAFAIAFSGCQKSQSSSVMRRAQVLGNENIQLKKQVADLETQVADLTGQLDQCQTQSKLDRQKMGEGYMKLMEQVAEYKKKMKQTESSPVTPPSPEGTNVN